MNEITVTRTNTPAGVLIRFSARPEPRTAPAFDDGYGVAAGWPDRAAMCFADPVGQVLRRTWHVDGKVFDKRPAGRPHDDGEADEPA